VLYVTEGNGGGEGYAKQIVSRMFGKPSAYKPFRPPVVIRPAGMIVEDLCQIEDMEWAKYAFSREPLSGKFDDAARNDLMQKAFECGEKAAQECIAQYETSDPQEIAKAMGLKVSYPMTPQDGGRVLFAEFYPPSEVCIYMDAVERANALFKKQGVREALGNVKIPNILLSHELFHFIEDQQVDEIWTKTYKIELWKIGPIRNRSRIVVLSEIAAMGFCKELNKLPYTPYVMDAFLVYGYSSDLASRLYEEMMRHAGFTAREPAEL